NGRSVIQRCQIELNVEPAAGAARLAATTEDAADPFPEAVPRFQQERLRLLEQRIERQVLKAQPVRHRVNETELGRRAPTRTARTFTREQAGQPLPESVPGILDRGLHRVEQILRTQRATLPEQGAQIGQEVVPNDPQLSTSLRKLLLKRADDHLANLDPESERTIPHRRPKSVTKAGEDAGQALPRHTLIHHLIK